MPKTYQTKLVEKVETWIKDNQSSYEAMIVKERSGAITKILSILISSGIILGLIFRAYPAIILIYATVSVAIALYSLYFGARKRANKKVQLLLLNADEKFKVNYDQEVLASGIGAKVPDWFIKAILIVFGLLFASSFVFR